MARGRVAAAFQKMVGVIQEHEDRIAELERKLLRAIKALARNRK